MPKKKVAPEVTEDIEAELGGGVSASPEDLKAVQDLVAAGITLQQRIEKGEELLKSLKAELNVLTTTTLPDTLARAGTSLYKVDGGPLDGWKAEVVPLVAGSLPDVTKNDDTPEKIADKKAKRERGLNWLREVGGEDIIKTELAIRFDKGQDNMMKDVAEYAREKGLDPDISSTVHHSTLCSFVREYLKSPDEEAPPLVAEDLGVFVGRVAKITAPKESKK